MTMAGRAGQALTMLTVAGPLAIGVAAHRVLFVAFSAASTPWVVPKTAHRHLPGIFAAPFAAAVAGLILLAIALLLDRVRKQNHLPKNADSVLLKNTFQWLPGIQIEPTARA